MISKSPITMRKDRLLKVGDIIYQKERTGTADDEPRTGMVVEVREHDHNVDHPWFGNSVVVLWSSGELSNGISARALALLEEVKNESR